MTQPTTSATDAVQTFNDTHPIGTPVRYWKGAREGNGKTARTRTAAQLLGGHTAVVWLTGVAGCISLTHVQPISEGELLPDQPTTRLSAHREIAADLALDILRGADRYTIRAWLEQHFGPGGHAPGDVDNLAELLSTADITLNFGDQADEQSAGLGSVPPRAQGINLAEECRIGAHAIRDAIGAVLAYGPGADWPALLEKHAQVWEETGKTSVPPSAQDLERAVIDTARAWRTQYGPNLPAVADATLTPALVRAVDALEAAGREPQQPDGAVS
ncbi:hypothetical protein [Polymorphospora lycopeni]|uniref:Uncharacterized protein n=1 Tax=Polymorphospora lycopeni TaxID=3140240 RepID=A0ABV5D235_9ACTN